MKRCARTAAAAKKPAPSFCTSLRRYLRENSKGCVYAIRVHRFDRPILVPLAIPWCNSSGTNPRGKHENPQFGFLGQRNDPQEIYVRWPGCLAQAELE